MTEQGANDERSIGAGDRASSGIGDATVAELVRRGFHVWATVCNPQDDERLVTSARSTTTSRAPALVRPGDVSGAVGEQPGEGVTQRGRGAQVDLAGDPQQADVPGQRTVRPAGHRTLRRRRLASRSSTRVASCGMSSACRA